MKKFTILIAFLLFVCGQLSAKVLYAEAKLRPTGESISYGNLSVPVMFDAETKTYLFPGFLGLISEDETANISKSDSPSPMGGYLPIFGGAFTKFGVATYTLNGNMGQTLGFVNDAEGSVTVLENVRFYFPHCLIYDVEYGYKGPHTMTELYADVLTTKEGVTTMRKECEVILIIALPTDEEFAGIDQISCDGSAAGTEYYNLQGLRVTEPAAGDIYIRRQGGRVSKVRF